MPKEKPIKKMREQICDFKFGKTEKFTCTKDCCYKSDCKETLLRLLECFEGMLLGKRDNRYLTYGEGWNAYRAEMIKVLREIREGIK